MFLFDFYAFINFFSVQVQQQPDADSDEDTVDMGLGAPAKPEPEVIDLTQVSSPPRLRNRVKRPLKRDLYESDSDSESSFAPEEPAEDLESGRLFKKRRVAPRPTQPAPQPVPQNQPALQNHYDDFGFPRPQEANKPKWGSINAPIVV